MTSYGQQGYTGAWPGHTNPSYHPVEQQGDVELISTWSQNGSFRDSPSPGAYQDFPSKPSFVSHERPINDLQYGGQQPYIYHDTLPARANVQGAVWRPGFWARFPYLGILSLVGVVACTFASIGILISSDGQDVATWGRIAPSVYLAILSVIANILMAIALTEGLIISFWRTLLQGCSLAELQRNWQCGHYFWHAILSGYRRGGRITAIACIFSAIALLRAPLFQKASIVQGGQIFFQSGSVNVTVAPVLPLGYAGMGTYSRSVNYDTSRLTPEFIDVMNSYSSNSPMVLDGVNCGEQCLLTVNGFGFQPDCQTDNITVHENIQAGQQYPRFNTTISLYKISQNNTRAYSAGILLNATFFANHAEYDGPVTNNATNSVLMKTYMTSHTCKLTGATVAYRLNITKNGVITLFDRSSDEYLTELELLSPGSMGDASVIGGFQYAGDYLFAASAIWNFGGAVSSITLKGGLANQMAASQNGVYWNNNFNDPMDIMLDAMRQVAFRASLKAGRENTTITNAQQTVLYEGSDTRTVYVTETKFMVIATVLALLSVIAIAATFSGWWKLGRSMSLSPLEIAKAFDAPLLKEVGSNLHTREFPDHIKDLKARYGASAVRKRTDRNNNDHFAYAGPGPEDAEVLVIASAVEVRPPRSEASYGK